MNPDLARLIELQRFETSAEQARRSIESEPQRSAALESRLETAQRTLADLKQRLTESQTARRTVEKDLGIIQIRLAKYKDQLMEVKTNREYQAMQKEIETAEHEVRGFEDKILERMLEADDLTAQVKRAEAALKDEEKAVTSERDALRREVALLQQQLDTAVAGREKLVASLDRQVLAVYQQAAHGRKGIGVSAAKNGICTECHVRLRPQMFNEVRLNNRIIQCDSCQRILYFEVVSQPAPSPLV